MKLNPLQHIKESHALRRLIRWSQGVVLPGFRGQSLYRVGAYFIREVQQQRLGERCAAVTYNFVMAIPPTLLFLFSLVPYLPLENVEQILSQTIQLMVPHEQLKRSLTGFISDFMNTERRDLLSFGILLTLFFSSNGMMGLMRSFDRSLPVYKKRSGLRRRWTAIRLTFALICVALVSIAVLIIQANELNYWLEQVFHNAQAVKVLSFLILTVIIFCTISIIYTYGPSLTHRFRFVSPGSVFATSLSVIVTAVFFYLVNHVLHYNQIYGSIGTLIAFMVWMWLNTLVILLGYELNVSILMSAVGRKTQLEHEPSA